MAKTQRDPQAMQEKNQESSLGKNTTLQAPLANDTVGAHSLLTHAADSPAQAGPGAILALQESYGNDEVRRAVQPTGTQEPPADRNGALNKYVSNEIQRARGGGAPLQPDLRDRMTQQFGHSFEGVRIHTDHKSDQISRQLQARAFTIGSNIFFRQGAFAPHSPDGRHTLMHELTHVVQQSGAASTASSGPLKLGAPNDRHEQEADRFASGAASHSATAVHQGVVQRDILSGIRGRFGGNTTTASPVSPVVPVPTIQPTVVTEEEWKALQKLGAPDVATWNAYEQKEKETIKSALASDTGLVKRLLSAKQSGNWPPDDTGAPLYDLDKLKLIWNVLSLPFSDWTTKIKPAHRKELLRLAVSNPNDLVRLVDAAINDVWPQDENDAEMVDIDRIKLISSVLSISFPEWKNKIKPAHRKDLLVLAASKPPYIRALALAALQDKWPKDENDAELKDDAILKKINETIKISFIDWSGTNKEHRKLLLAMAAKPYVGTLVRVSIGNTWPKDGSDSAIKNEADIEKIIEKMKIDLGTWNSITEKGQRGYLLSNAEKTYITELASAAAAGKFPKDETGFIYDDAKLQQIKTKMKLSFFSWSSINNAQHRGYLFKAVPILDEKFVAELASGVASGIWPKDGANADISEMSKWKLVKAVAPGFSPAYWNGFDATTRGAALAEPDDTKRKNLINEANYKRDSDETGLEKAGNLAEHTGVETLTGSLGLASNITSASKGLEDNSGIDRASGIVGAIGDTGSMVASGTSFLGNLAKYRRGKRMASDENYSRAAKTVGNKEQSKGAWGMASSGIGFFGSAFSLSGNMTKSIGADSDEAMAASGGLTGTAGVIGTIGGMLGTIKSSMSVHGSRTRSNAAQGFVMQQPTSGTLSAEELKMNQVAQFTAKNQNKAGRGLGLFKGLMSIGSGLSTAIGGFGGIASKGAGLGGDIAGAVFSGLGLLGGLAQWGVESQTKPKDADVDAQVQNLIDLLQMGDPNGKKAAEFAKNVLKISFINLGDDKTWKDWIEEDPQAAKDLIKSKITKL